MTSNIQKMVKDRLSGVMLHPSEYGLSNWPKSDVLDQMTPYCRALDLVRSNFEECRVEYAYFIKCGEFVKIGRTTRPVEDRVSSFQVGCPYDFETIAIVPSRHPIEKLLHSIFKEYKHRGEWFKLERDLLSFTDKLPAILKVLRRYMQ